MGKLMRLFAAKKLFDKLRGRKGGGHHGGGRPPGRRRRL
jgi:hypothetical protein